MGNLDFQGTAKLLRFYLRHGWITWAIWLLTPTLLVISAVASYGSMFASQQELVAFVDESILNPAVAAIHGYILSIDIPGIIAWRVKMLAMIIVGIFNIFAMTKITRGEEESSRAEMLMSGVVGRQAPLAASAILCFASNIIMGLLMFATMTTCGLPVGGSLSLSLLLIVVSCLFAALGAVTSQLYSAKRMASSAAMGALGAFYFISFFNNLSSDNNLTSYFTPFRWFFIIRPFAGDHLGFLVVGVLSVAVFAYLALLLSSKRDVGAGMINPKTGRRDAVPGFRNEWALGWRQHCGMLFTWTIILGIVAFGIGNVNALVSKMLQEQPTLASWMDMFGAPEEAFLSLMLYIISLFVAAYGILAAGRMYSEETDGRAESLFGTPMKRTSWMASHVLFTILGPFVILFVVGCATAIGSAVSGVGTGTFLSFLSASLIKLPAVLVMTGIVVLFFGMFPKIGVALSWSLFSLFIAIQLSWEMGILSETVFLLTPFGHVYPTQPQTIQTFLALSAVALLLYAVGLIGFKRRDLLMNKIE